MYPGPFGCLTKPGGKRVELVKKFVPRSRIRIFYNECTKSTPLDPKLMFWCVLYHLGAFGTVWLPYETRCKTVQTISCHEVASEIFATNASDPHHWTLNKCFCAFRTIWVHSGPFGCLTKLGAQRVELVKKFVPRSRVRIFRNECTRSTQIGPLTDVLVWFELFGCIWDRLVALRNSVQNGPN